MPLEPSSLPHAVLDFCSPHPPCLHVFAGSVICKRRESSGVISVPAVSSCEIRRSAAGPRLSISRTGQPCCP